MSSPDDIPGTSKPRATKRSPRTSSSDSKSMPSPPQTTSNGAHGSPSGRSPSAGRSPAGNRSPAGGRSPVGGQSPGVGPTNMRDRLLVSNAIAMDVSASESTSSSSSPQMNGHNHDDSNESDQLNGGSTNGTSRKSKKKKKKSHSRRERRLSGDSALMGWTGGFPKLTAMASIDSSSDLEPQEKEMEKEQPAKAEEKQDDQDKQQQQPAENPEQEEQIESLVVTEDENSSSVPPVLKSSSPPSTPRSRKRAFSPAKKENTKKTTPDEAMDVSLDESAEKTEDIPLPVSSRFAKRFKSFCSQTLQSVELMRRTSRFSSQEPPAKLEEELAPVVGSKESPDPKPEAAAAEAPPTPSALKLKATDEFYRLPFAYGWKRELVLPSTGNPKRRTGDVFFIAPNGRKLRSREDIVPMLKGELTIEHFCFQRQAQEAGPEFELVRRATPSSVQRRKSQQAVAQPAPLPVTGKRVSKPKVPKGASPPSEGWTATMAVKGNSRVLASSNGSSSSTGATIVTTSTRKRSFMSRQSSRLTSEKIVACIHCQAPLQGSPKTNICQNCSKIKRKKERESEMTAEPQPENEDQDEEQNDDGDETESVGSLLEIGEEIEVPGQQPPAELFNNLGHRRSPKDQEVVVIGGRKAIAIKADPPRRQVKVVPRQPDLTGYEKIYSKRSQVKNSDNELVESLGNAHNGCQVLMAIMKTMNLKDRANMSRVCKTWAMVSREMSVWRSVSLRDTYVGNWLFCMRELARHRTRELDMMGVIMAKPQLRFAGDLRVLKALRVLRTDAVDGEFLQLVFRHLPQLLELRATCTSATLNLCHLEQSAELRVLRIHMTEPKSTLVSLDSLAKLTHLTELSLRGVSDLGKLNLLFLKDLAGLEVLSLGSCQDLNSSQFGTQVLPALKLLRSFRLENDHKGMAMFPVDEIMLGLSKAGGVKRLELVNVDVDGGFSALLADCPSVTDLLLTPKCMHNTANMTNAVMQAISDNAEQLLVFRLGLVTQLLSATGALYKGKGKDVIPVQRPVPGIPENDHLNHCSGDDNCQETEHSQCVAFLPVERLKAILHHMMPQAWLTVAKVAMCETTSIKFLPRPEESSEENF
ncbi:serine/arginine repetitive matrix protein 2 isoform X2 [Drosophila takahashii]|uniref:serine/arginine repetitive matrix protein 2 isoform X2 n=1 Tax=Drosophila takahashii TaxID=29030 RepID=UPI003898E23E